MLACAEVLSLGSIHTLAGEDSLPTSILQMGMAKLQLPDLQLPLPGTVPWTGFCYRSLPPQPTGE